MRMLASLDAYLASQDADGVQVHQYVTGELTAELADRGRVALATETDYPWSGEVRIQVTASVDGPWTLSLRVPSWADGATVRVVGEQRAAPAGAYVELTRGWVVGDTVELHVPVAVRTVTAHPRVDAVRGCVALERGPLVYAVEQVDQQGGVEVDDLHLAVGADVTVAHRPDLLGGVSVLRTRGRAGPDGPEVDVVAIPYHLWAHRGVGAMRVWLPAG